MMASSCKRVVSSVSRRLLHSSTEVVVGELAPRPCNFGKYVVALEGDGLKFSSNRELLQYYVNTLKQVVGSKSRKEAKTRIYAVWCVKPFGFGAEMDKKTAELLKGSKTLGVIDVLPDYAFDVKDKAFGTLIISPSGKNDDPDIAYVLPEVPEIDLWSDEDDYERELCTEDDESDSCLDSEDDESERDSFPDDSKLKL